MKKFTKNKPATEGLGRLIKQNNYTNLCMQTIGAQLIRIEDTSDKIQTFKKSKDCKEIKFSEKIVLSTALVKPTIELTQGFNLGSSSRYSKEIIDALSSKLDKLNLS